MNTYSCIFLVFDYYLKYIYIHLRELFKKALWFYWHVISRISGPSKVIRLSKCPLHSRVFKSFKVFARRISRIFTIPDIYYTFRSYSIPCRETIIIIIIMIIQIWACSIDSSIDSNFFPSPSDIFITSKMLIINHFRREKWSVIFNYNNVPHYVFLYRVIHVDWIAIPFIIVINRWNILESLLLD